MARDLPRRRFGQGVVSTLAAAMGGAALMERFRNRKIHLEGARPLNDSNSYLGCAGRQELLSTPAEILETFYSLRYGGLAYRYHHLWPLYLDPAKLHELDEISAAQSRSAANAYSHRLRSLPTLIRIYGLADVDSESEKYLDHILSVHRTAFDPLQRPQRVIVDSIWNVATNTIGKDLRAWRTVEFGAGLVDEARSVCEAFLGGELILIFPALSAWQFLLTYRNALRDRGDHHDRDRRHTEKAIERILADRRALKSYWLQEMQALCDSHSTFETLLPQFGELPITYSVGQYSRRAIEYSIRARLAHAYISDLEDQNGGPRRSPYRISLQGTAVGPQSRDILRNYGVSTKEILQLLSAEHDSRDLRLGLTYDAVNYWKQVLLVESERSATAELTEQHLVSQFLHWSPFRLSKRSQVAQQTAGSVSADELSSLIRREGAVGGFALLGLEVARVERARLMRWTQAEIIPEVTPYTVASDLEEYAARQVDSISELVRREGVGSSSLFSVHLKSREDARPRRERPTLSDAASKTSRVRRPASRGEVRELENPRRDSRSSNSLVDERKDQLNEVAKLSPVYESSSDEEKAKLIEAARSFRVRVRERAMAIRQQRLKMAAEPFDEASVVRLDSGETGSIVTLDAEEVVKRITTSKGNGKKQ